MAKQVTVLIKDKDRQYEGLRSSLGLLLEDHQVNMVVLNHAIDMDEEYQDNMGFIDEMGGARYSNVPVNIEQFGFQPVTTQDVAQMLIENEVVIPF